MNTIPEYAGAIVLIFLCVALGIAILGQAWATSRRKHRDRLVRVVERGFAAELASSILYASWWGCGAGTGGQEHLEAEPYEVAQVIAENLREHGCMPTGERFREDLRAIVKKRKLTDGGGE